MKYYSEKLKKLFDTQEALKKAEDIVLKAEAEKLAKKLIPNGEYKDFSFYRWNIA